MNSNDTENLKLITHTSKLDHRKASKKDDQIKCETNPNQIQYSSAGNKHSLHCVNRNLATYPIPNSQIQTANYLNSSNKKDQQPPFAQHRPAPFYQQHHHHSHPANQPHIHHFHQPNSESVYNQTLHYLHPHQFYYLHNQPKFFTGSPHQCQFTNAAAIQPAQLTHSGSANLLTNCSHVNSDNSGPVEPSSNQLITPQSSQQPPAQQLQTQTGQQQTQITNPNYTTNQTSTAAISNRPTTTTNYQPQTSHYQSVNAAAPYQSHHYKKSHKDNKMNAPNYDSDHYKKTRKWEVFPGKFLLYYQVFWNKFKPHSK